MVSFIIDFLNSKDFWYPNLLFSVLKLWYIHFKCYNVELGLELHFE